MALLFCDGFDHYASADISKKWDVSNSNSCFTIASTYKRTGTGCLRYDGRGGDWNNLRYVKKILSANYTTLVCGFYMYAEHLNSGYIYFLRFYDGITCQIDIRFNSGGTISVYRDVGGTLLGTCEYGIVNEGSAFFEIKAVFDNTTGSVIINKDSTKVFEITEADTCNSANEYANGIAIGGQSYDPNVCTFDVDDFYIDDTNFLGDIKVETIYPSGAGTTTQWDASAGSNYECVDEASLNSDTDYVSTATANEIDTYAFGNLATTAGTVYGVQVNMIARKDDAGSRSIAPVVRPASTDRVGTTQSIGDSYVDYMQMYTTNPENSAAWTIADVNGAEFGIKLIE